MRLTSTEHAILKYAVQQFRKLQPVWQEYGDGVKRACFLTAVEDKFGQHFCSNWVNPEAQHYPRRFIISMWDECARSDNPFYKAIRRLSKWYSRRTLKV